MRGDLGTSSTGQARQAKTKQPKWDTHNDDAVLLCGGAVSKKESYEDLSIHFHTVPGMPIAASYRVVHDQRLGTIEEKQVRLHGTKSCTVM